VAKKDTLTKAKTKNKVSLCKVHSEARDRKNKNAARR
jgi:hypothetical protein